MKKILGIIFSVALCVILAACNNNQALNMNENSDKPPFPASPTAPETTIDEPTEPDKSVDNLDDIYNAYTAALENLIQNHILPDGTDGGTQYNDMAANKFDICDVDNDGREELLLFYTTTSEGGWAGFVLGYDAKTKKLQTELRESTLLTFYDNGIISAKWKNNHTFAGDFWPYSLYQYAPETDSYVLIGMVDAWDKNYYLKTDNQNNPFPSDIDKSGTGFVYYIMEDGQYDNTHPVDASEYNDWINAYIGNASEIQIKYIDLTEENISQIRSGS